MSDEGVIVTAARASRCCRIAILAAVAFAVASPASWEAVTDRCRSLFGGKSDERPQGARPPGSQEAPGELFCPPVSIRGGASTYAVGLPGKQAAGNDLRFLVSITRTARQCTIDNGQITARIGIQGRVIAGPAGAPAMVVVPMRTAVVQAGVQEKTIATKVYQTTVSMSEDGSVPFTLVAEDLVYPAPSAAVGDSYVFYIGFDPQALKPEPKPKAPKKK